MIPSSTSQQASEPAARPSAKPQVTTPDEFSAPTGKIQEERTYPRSADPRKSKG
jgi:hypothetical protein